MKRRTVGIVAYGAGNISSVELSLYRVGYRSCIVSTARSSEHYDLLLLPGVGAFAPAMEVLRDSGLSEYIQDHVKRGDPILGICLGMQLLASSSSENGNNIGLDIIPGDVVKLPNLSTHVGWNNLETTRHSFLSFSDGLDVYFNHSYFFKTETKYCLAKSRLESKEDPFPVAVKKDNVLGLQFHPEKSQIVGQKILSAALESLIDA